MSRDGGTVVAQWWHSENERGLSVDGRSLTGNKATGCLRIADLLHMQVWRYYHRRWL